MVLFQVLLEENFTKGKHRNMSFECTMKKL